MGIRPSTKMEDRNVHETSVTNTLHQSDISTSLSTSADTTATMFPPADIPTSISTFADTTATTSPLADLSTSFLTLADTTTAPFPLSDISTSLSTLAYRTTTTSPLPDIPTCLSMLTVATTTISPTADISTFFSTISDTSSTTLRPADISTSLLTLTDINTTTSPLKNAITTISTLANPSSSETKQHFTATTAASFTGIKHLESLLSDATTDTPPSLAGDTTAQTSLSDTTTFKTVLHDAFANPVSLNGTGITKSPLSNATTDIPTFILTSSSSGNINMTLSTLAETTSSENILQGTDTTVTSLAGPEFFATPPSEPTTNIASLINTLKFLIERQAIFCGVKSLCTIKGPSFMQPKETRGCCGYCSCDPNCLKNHNCCVDFAVKTVHGNATFSSARELIVIAFEDDTVAFEIGNVIERIYILNDRADKTRVIEPTGVDKDLDNDTIAAGKDDSGNSIDDIECLPRQMLRGRGFVGEHFEIVTGCSRRHLNSSSACTVQKPVNSTGFVGNIPVTSLTTGKTYRNKTVLDCCGDTRGSFEYWDMFIECDGVIEFIPIYVQLPLQLQDGQYFDKRCDALFEPCENIRKRGLVPRKCSRVHISTCEHVPPGVQGLFIKRFCEVESQFMRLINSGKSTIYKNVACVLCNRKYYDSDSHCTRATDSDGAMKIRVNLKDMPKDGARDGSLDDGGLLNGQALSKLARFIGDCPDGHIYIQALDECKRVFCPRSMFIVNGSCVPLYDHVTGASFVTIFNITVISSQTNKVNRSLFELQLVKFLKTDAFADVSLTTERLRMRSLGRTYTIEMILTPKEARVVTMNNVVGAVASLYFTTVNIRVSPNAIVRIGISPGDSWYFEGVRSKGTSQATHSTEASHVFDVTIRVSESYACNRIAIAMPLFNVSRQFWVYMPLIDEKISFENVDSLRDSNELLVCVDLFLDGSRQFNVDLNSRVNPRDMKQSGDEKIASFFANETSKYSVLILIIGVAGTLLCVIGRLSAGKIWATMAHCRRESEVNI